MSSSVATDSCARRPPTGDAFDTEQPDAVVSSLRWLTPTRKPDDRFQYPLLSVRLTDDLAGIQRFTVNVATTTNPDSLHTLATHKLVSGSTVDGTWIMAGAIRASLPTNTLFVRQLVLIDGVGHTTYVNLPAPTSRLTMSRGMRHVRTASVRFTQRPVAPLPSTAAV
jgi:hypothetical protein